MVAALAAAAGVGTTLAVQHATAARPGASQTPRDAAAGQPGAMREAVAGAAPVPQTLTPPAIRAFRCSLYPYGV